MPGFTVVPRYFDTYTKVALALSSSGEAIGGVIFPLITNKLNTIYGWEGMFLLLSAIALQICVCGMLYRPVKNEKGKDVTFQKQRKANDWSFLKMWKFQILYLTGALYGFGASIIYGHLGAYAAFELHIDLSKTAMVYSIIGISMIFFKIIIGILAELSNKCCIFEPLTLYILLFATGGIGSLILPFISDFSALMAFSISFGASYASLGGALTPSILIRLYGEKGLDQLGLTYGVMFAYWGVGYILGSPAAGN